MRINEFEITIKGGNEGTAPELAGAGTKHLKAVKYVPGQPKKSNQKKWQPPLQQLLDVLKAGIGVERQLVDPNNPAAKLAFAAGATDPAIGMVEDQGVPLQHSVKMCLECGHLVFAKALSESIDSVQLTEFEKKWDKIAARYTGGIPRCTNECKVE